MADVLRMTNLVSSSTTSSCNSFQNRQNVCVVPKSCKLKGFPLKVKFSALRSQTLNSEFHGKRIVLQSNQGKSKKGNSIQPSMKAQSGLSFPNVQKWWEKGLKDNMREVTSAQDLVDSLLNAGDKLVVVDFFSPGCGGCKALHPKICQLAEMNPDVQFLQVNYEEHKSMCYSLNVHVLPFFRFYRGAHGRLCSFSCTNATIQKFKVALAKHTPDRVSLGPTKGLEEKELLALAANKELNFTYTPKPDQEQPSHLQEEIPSETIMPNSSPVSPPLPQQCSPLAPASSAASAPAASTLTPTWSPAGKKRTQQLRAGSTRASKPFKGCRCFF